MKELKESILRIHNLMRTVNEEKISDLPPDIQKAIQKMENDFGVDITDNHISKELEQEGGWQKDSGGEDPQARKQIEKLISSAKSEFGDRIPSKSIVSGYRSYGDQVRNFGNKAQKRGVDNTQTSNAIPGFSQHHNGKTFDIFSVETNWWNQNLDIKDWVANNCDDFGFKVTYKTKGPLRIAEPWHLTYIGGEKNKDIQPITDEEVDAYFFSERVDEKLEKKIEKQYPKKGCKPSSNFTNSPSLDKVRNGLEVIRIGHQGEEVEKIQQRLYDKGYDLGPCGVDGLFGTRTKKALEKFQSENQLTISSSIDEPTIKKLFTDETKSKTNTTVQSSDKIKYSGDTIPPSGGFKIKSGDGEEIDLDDIAASGAGGRKSLTLKAGSGRGKEFSESLNKKYNDLKISPSVEWAVANCTTGQIVANSSNAGNNIYGASVPKIVIAAAALHNNGGNLKGNVLGSKEKEWNGIINLLVKSENDPAWINTQKVAGGKEGVMSFVSQMGYKNMIPTRSPAMINALDMVNFYIDVIQGNFRGANAIQQISSASQTSNARSKVYIPSGTPMGGKTGTWSSYNHDTGWLYYNGQYWSIVVLTTGKSSEDVAIMWGGLFREYIEK